MTTLLSALATSTTEYTAHPLADLFPRMKDADYVALKESIRTQGLLQPIVLFEGRILDGRHRYQACRELDLPLETVEYTGDDPTGYVWSANGERRQLTAGQIACVAIEMFPAVEAITRQRQRAGKRRKEGDDLGEFVPQGQRGRTYIAALYGVNERYLSIAKRLKAGAPDLFVQAWMGAMTLPEAVKQWKEREGKTPRPHPQKRSVAVTSSEDTVGQQDLPAIGHDDTKDEISPASAITSPCRATAITTELVSIAAATGCINVPERVPEDTLVAHPVADARRDYTADGIERQCDEEMVAAPQRAPVEPLDSLSGLLPPRDATDVAAMVCMVSASAGIDLVAVMLALLQNLAMAERVRVAAALAPAFPSICASDSQRADHTPDSGRQIENPEKRWEIALAHALRARGVSPEQIANALNAHNLHGVRRHPWERRRVGELLKNSEAPVLPADEQDRLEGWVREALEGLETDSGASSPPLIDAPVAPSLETWAGRRSLIPPTARCGGAPRGVLGTARPDWSARSLLVTK